MNEITVCTDFLALSQMVINHKEWYANDSELW